MGAVHPPLVRTCAHMTTVSVVMTTFDGAPFVGRQLASILAQTVLPTELLVGDDGSSDGTVEVVRATLAQAPFAWDVRVNPSRLGVTGNIESLLRRASGDVIFLADQDDEWVREKIEVVLAAFEAHPGIDGVFSDASLIDAASSRIPGSLWAAVHFDRHQRRRWEAEPFDVLMRRNVATGATMAVRRRVLAEVLPLSRHGWHDFWIASVLVARDSLRALDAQLVRYRLHGSNQAGVPPRGLVAIRLPTGGGALVRRDQERQLLDLVRRLEELGLQPQRRLHDRIEHLQYRARLPQRPVARARTVVSRLPRRDYWQFASGWRSVASDLLVPRRPADR